MKLNENGDRSPSGHDEVKRFYDTRYYAKGRFSDSPLDWHTRRIAARLGKVRDCQVLDVACGTGAWLQHLQDMGATPSGVDVSAVAVGNCLERLSGGDILEGTAESLPFADQRFDLVTCLGSLEHFLDQPKALKEMRRVAKQDARILILVPNAGFLTRRLRLYRGTLQASLRETVRSLSEWEEMFYASGLQVDARWRDLHPLSMDWILRGNPFGWLFRLAQALALCIWPMSWQYQVYFLCHVRAAGAIEKEGSG